MRLLTGRISIQNPHPNVMSDGLMGKLLLSLDLDSNPFRERTCERKSEGAATPARLRARPAVVPGQVEAWPACGECEREERRRRGTVEGEREMGGRERKK